MFKIIKPTSLLRQFVKEYWILETDGLNLGSSRTFPTGLVRLTFHRGKRILKDNGILHPFAFAQGQTMKFEDLTSTGALDMISVLFRPAGANLFFNLPIEELFNYHIDVTNSEDRSLSEVYKKIQESEGVLKAISFIEEWLISKLTGYDDYNFRRINHAVTLINNNPSLLISDLAHSICMCDRHFSRIFKTHIGVKTSDFVRIVRFQRAIWLLQLKPEINFAEITVKCGYYDQSHFSREFKLFTGYIPGEFTSKHTPTSDYFSSFE